MAWTVSFEPRALAEFKKLDNVAQKRMAAFLRERVSGENNPRQHGKALTGEKAGLWRYRIGSYRAVCWIDDANQKVLVLRVAHRKEVYR